ncbi:hypothetical protein A8F94_13975 [Bacillus sp. FJAT-27225]|uniref:glycosyltransferase family 4 protein n=1 Tax=Bacillus sp. FJAT-27225 TaxID=1743144 RepID=UPI00080C20A0|nr:glycosyltransferase family 4 protein [Bacillus sp. FJAT-27225]OCA86134.1 hypothetical protein A8F94_13975 [Bacillus sp. FJAT-27225]
MKRKVLLICETLSGGVRKHIIDILQYLSEEKFEIAIAYGKRRADQLFLEFEHKNKHRFTFYPIDTLVREINLLQDLRTILQLNRIMKDFQPEIIHCHSSKAGGAGRLAALFYKSRKIFYTPHGYIMQYPYVTEQKRQVFGLIEKYLGYITDYTINVSEGEQAVGLRYDVFATHKSEVIYNGVEEKEPLEEPDKKDGKIVIGTLARFDQAKDPESFLEIAKLIVSRNPNVEVWWAGEGEFFKEQFLEAIRHIPQIKYCGFVRSIDLFLKEIDIYLSTSLHEAMPYSILEAMAMKKPIVASNVEGNNELVDHGYNGYLYPPGNTEEATVWLTKLIHDETEMKRLQKNSYQLFKERFHIKNMIQRLEQVYQR